VAQLGHAFKLQVRQAGDSGAEWRLLGSIDGGGTHLLDAVRAAFATLDYRIPVDGYDEPQSEVTFARDVPMDESDRVGAILNHHRFGDRGVLNRVAAGDAVPFTEQDNQQVELGALVLAAPTQRVGFLALQSPNGRAAKRGVERELKRHLKEHYGLFLDVQPVLPLQAVGAALEAHGTGAITFRKLNTPGGLFDNEADWWSDAGDVGEADLRLKPSRGIRFVGQRLLGFIKTRSGTLDQGEEPTSFQDLATFDDKVFDEVTVEVNINGRAKTIYVTEDGYTMASAFSWDLELASSPSDKAIMDALAEIAHP
jgi:hypothetical protein